MIILAHHEDETCAHRLRGALVDVMARPGVVLVVSADALADDGIWAAAQAALKAGALRLFLWRECVVDVLDKSALNVGADLKVSRLSWRAPLVYPTSGRWIGDGGDMTAALGDLARDLRT